MQHDSTDPTRKMQPSLRQGRLSGRDHFWDGKKKQIFIAITAAFLMLQLLFLGNLSYIFGTVFNESTRIHNLNVLLVDYDGGEVGQSVQAAYQALQANSFPTIVSKDTADYPTVDSIRSAVCRGDYWAAAYVHNGASTRLASALDGSAVDYNASNTATYIWNEARYPTVQEGLIVPSLETLFGAATSVYYRLSGVSTSGSFNTSSQVAMSALLDPISPTSMNLNPTKAGSRVFYNTIAIVMPIIQQFFFLMALNGISTTFGVLEKLSIKGNGLMRGILAFCYTLVAAFATAGYIFAFKQDWNEGGKQYILTVLTYWLFMHINFLILDIVTAFIPMSFLPFFVLTYAITSVASSVVPFEVSPGFYRWGYVYPAHETYTILVQIWGHGCNNELYRALPILFAWEVVGLAGAVAANYYRCTQVAKAASQNQGSDNVVSPSSEKSEMTAEVTQMYADEKQKAVLGPSYPLPFEDTLLGTLSPSRTSTT